MEKVVSLSADLTNLQLQKIFQRTNPAARILACEKIGGPMRNPRYAFVIATPDGDYSVLSVDLIQVGMMASDYTIGSKIMLHERGLQTMYDATRAIENIKHSAVASHSGPPPLSSIKFSLDDFGIEASPLIDTVLEEWRQTQTISPIRYAVYNQPRGEIEISLADPSADNDEEHVAELREAIASELHKNFDDVNVAQPDPAAERSGRYSRRYENLRNHDMSLIRLTIPGQELVSESAARNVTNKYVKFAKVDGKVTMVMPGSARLTIASLKRSLKSAKKYRTQANKAKAQAVKAREAAKTATTPERKSSLRAKAKKLSEDAKKFSEYAKAHMKDIRNTHTKSGLRDLIMPLNPTVLADEKKLAAVKLDSFGYKGKKGVFVPKFTTKAKFEALGSGVKTKKAPATRMMKGATGGHSAAKEKIARESGLMGNKRKTVAARGPAGGGKKPKAASAATSDKSLAGKIDKALSGILQKLGFKFNTNRSAGLIRNLKGGKIAQSNEGIAKMRDALAKKFNVKDTAKGFEIPGLLEVKTGPTGVVIVRPDRYDKSNDPAVRVKSTSAVSESAKAKKAPIKVDGHLRSAVNRLVHDKIKGSLTDRWHYRLYGTKITFINESTRKNFSLGPDELKSEGITSREAAAVARVLGIKSAN